MASAARSGSRVARRAAVAVVVGSVMVALLADFLASDRPIVVHTGGDTYWFANIIDYDNLADRSGDELRASMGPDDWAVWAPVRRGPERVRTAGKLALTASPSGDHWLGTDDRGRDVLARLIHGTRATVIIAALVAGLALLFGLGLGAVSAARGGAVDRAVVATADGASSVPAIVVVVAAQGLIGHSSVWVVAVLLALPRAADTARLARANIAAALASEYAAAAAAMGLSRARVVLRHAIPNALGPLWVASAMTASLAVLAEAALSFIGFGVPAPTASWGELLAQAHQNDLQWWLAWPAGLAVASLALALGALAQPARSRRV